MIFSLVNKGNKVLTRYGFEGINSFSRKHIVDSEGKLRKVKIREKDVYKKCSIIKFKYRNSVFLTNDIIESNNLQVGQKIENVVEFERHIDDSDSFVIGLGTTSLCNTENGSINISITPRAYYYTKEFYKYITVDKKEYLENKYIKTLIQLKTKVSDFDNKTLNYFFSNKNYSIPEYVLLGSLQERVKFLQAVILSDVFETFDGVYIFIKVNSAIFVDKFKDLIWSLGGAVKTKYMGEGRYNISFTLPRHVLYLLDDIIKVDVDNQKDELDEIIDIESIGLESCSIIETTSEDIILNEFLTIKGGYYG